MICLDIRVKNEYGNYLNKIFNMIDLSNYMWEINADDFLYSEDEIIKEKFFEDNVLNGETFFKCISRDSYYMIFADIKAFPLGNECIKIETFEDFLKSSCEIVLLCTDSTFIEFYCKNEQVLNKVYNNCIENGFEKVECRSIEDVLGRCLVAW